MSKYKVHISTEYIVEADDPIAADYIAQWKFMMDAEIDSDLIHLFHFTSTKLEEDDTRVDTED